MKTRFFLLLLLFLLPVFISAQNWQVVWHDEFEGESLDLEKWSYQTGTGSEYGLIGWGNNELQYYREQNVTVSDGLLHITSKRENYNGKSYTSGRIRTIDKGDWTYCRIEFRAKMPLGKGLWAAVWMLPTDEEYGGWAASGELDIMEYLGDEHNVVHGTLHFGDVWDRNEQNGTSFTLSEGDFYSEFHDFTLEWVEGEMKWFVDGELYQTQGLGNWFTVGEPFPAPFDKDFHLLINLAVGGNWPGNPVGTFFPQELVLDYIRVFQDLPIGIEEDQPERQMDLGLHQNFPNPFHLTTSIAYTIDQDEHVRLEVYDATGRKVDTLVDEHRNPGTYSVIFDGTDLAPGLYTCKFSSGDFQESKHLLRVNK
jgi:beta-glucanase (GH16 family)